MFCCQLPHPRPPYTLSGKKKGFLPGYRELHFVCVCVCASFWNLDGYVSTATAIVTHVFCSSGCLNSLKLFIFLFLFFLWLFFLSFAYRPPPRINFSSCGSIGVLNPAWRWFEIFTFYTYWSACVYTRDRSCWLKIRNESWKLVSSVVIRINNILLWGIADSEPFSLHLYRVFSWEFASIWW